MTARILTLSDKVEWELTLAKLSPPLRDIYYKPDYYGLYENMGYGKTECFVFEDNQEVALYPYLRNNINKLGYNLEDEYFDIQGAYGYNGVISSCNENWFSNLFYDSFNNYCKEEKIIAEFTRFNPILRNHIFSRDLEVIHERNNVFVDLSIDDFEKESFIYSVKKNIKKAKRNLLTCYSLNGKEVEKLHLQNFIDIYYLTMDRNKAEKYYYFSSGFFQSIISSLAEYCTLYFVNYYGKNISTELVLYGNEIAYSFLGGTLSEFFDLRPNDYLKEYIIKDLKSSGLKTFCLGGGREGVFNYKKNFAKNGIIPFYIGKRIHNPKIYNEVVEQWSLRSPEKLKKYKNYILKYRY